MEISHQKFKDECSCFYKLGYKTAYRDVFSFLHHEIEAIDNIEIQSHISRIIENVKEYYSSYPCIEPLE
jgi:uncharacterized protein (DUF927 family)